MRALSQAEWQERDIFLSEVARAPISAPERLARLGVTPTGVEELGRRAAELQMHRPGWTAEGLCPHYRVGVMLLDARGGTSGTSLGEIDGRRVLAWTL